MAAFGSDGRPACRHFLAGSCMHGEACRFSHAVVDTRKRVPCRHFFAGGCRNGESCPYSHDLDAPSESREHALLAVVEARTAPTFALDVECVATGPTHRDRAVAQIGLVDEQLRVVLNLFVKPKAPVVSYLTPLTGITRELIDSQGIAIEEAVAALKTRLPVSAVLVGTNVGQDATWLGLKTPSDFASLLDLSPLFKVWDPARRKFAYFGQDHLAKCWLGHPRPPGVSHDAVGDAATSMMLLHAFLTVRRDPARLAMLHHATLNTPRDPSFAARHPVFEGVCQGNLQTCKCNAPHFL
ncbi:hypothetical protein CTAYLR_002695 [Chrysophaeum taylorii]|uniref:C3H1-type domain-containing protein n=1 Tax=Chrysophaeum taylorii TaxID=2483200 RepID=A0AAD7UBK0_9STRA|nr:hypothetical protein CTAYLR_002695 [Chrysophaeum taylorii]